MEGGSFIIQSCEVNLGACLELSRDELVYLLEGGELNWEAHNLDLQIKMIKKDVLVSDLDERYKTCGRCVHDGEGDTKIAGLYCYLCKRNPIADNRIDFFEERKEEQDE